MDGCLRGLSSDMNLSDIINERPLTSFSTKVNLDVKIKADATKHADERKFRHDVEITDSDIRATLVKATEPIIQSFINGEVESGDAIHILDKANGYLNIIARFNMNRKGTPEFITVVTVMRKKGFIQKDVAISIKV